jgi:hypothetical protein
MAKGLCMKCGKKWHRGHTYAAAVQLNVLQELWDILEPESITTESNSPDDTPTDQVFMVLSEMVLCGKDAPRTLKIRE